MTCDLDTFLFFPVKRICEKRFISKRDHLFMKIWTHRSSWQPKHQARKPKDRELWSSWVLLELITWKCQSLSHIWFFVTPWTVAYQSPLSEEFSWQEYWSRLPCPPPEDLPDPGIEPASLLSLVLAGGFFTTEPSGKPHGMKFTKFWNYQKKISVFCFNYK